METGNSRCRKYNGHMIEENSHAVLQEKIKQSLWPIMHKIVDIILGFNGTYAMKLYGEMEV
jgi:hypothetical protein